MSRPAVKPRGAFLDHLVDHPTLGDLVSCRRRLPAEPAQYATTERPLAPRLAEAFASIGVERLYTHQAAAIDRARAGRDLLLVTPTASGKTLCFATVALEAALADRDARALFLYPTKALAQDQVGTLRDVAGGLGALDPPRFEIYDGDTPAPLRRKIKADPPQVLLTNPDMLHFGMLAHHHDWAGFLSKLRYVVLDEAHVYRGLFGAHVHHIIARLLRLAASYGARPQIIAASATIGNPGAFAASLLGREVDVVEASGAPRPPRDVAFLNPVATSPYTVAVKVISEAIERRYRTIAFTKARKVTELLHQWLSRQAPKHKNRVAPYRAGYLPAERRAIEARLFRGDLLAVLTTSALELGIDIGALDLCVLVGYPGSLMSSWQRIGRVGRGGRRGEVVFIALPDALDQYVVRHPDAFFDGAFEKLVLNPHNPSIAAPHAVCAAAERPFVAAEAEQAKKRPFIQELLARGELLEDADGETIHAARRRPHREVRPRSAGEPFQIVLSPDGDRLGEIDGLRVWQECHPGAVYLHGGKSYLIEKLEPERRRAWARQARLDYYTQVTGEKRTEVLEVHGTARLGDFPIGIGRLKVTTRVREYQKKRLRDGEVLGSHPLDLPPVSYETIGLWIEMPEPLPAAFAEADRHFMGSIHAAEHAMIHLFPLLAIADSGDVGGISYTRHPQLRGPAVFLYDGIPGGAGLAEEAYRELSALVSRTRDHLVECPCEDGCPACVQSPRCGNGNKPLDKAGAIDVLGLWLGEGAMAELELEALPDREGPLPPFPEVEDLRGDLSAPGRHGMRRVGNEAPGFFEEATGVDHRVEAPVDRQPPPTQALAPGGRVLVFDLETRRAAAEVGGWQHAAKMGISVAVVWDSESGESTSYLQQDVDRLLFDLAMADRVVGFNVDGFDMQVLAGFTERDLSRIRTLDMLVEIKRTLGRSLSLEHLAAENLGEGKSADGLQALAWWREGRVDLIDAYCRKDVEVTRRLYELGRDRGYLIYRDKDERRLRVPTRW